MKTAKNLAPKATDDLDELLGELDTIIEEAVEEEIVEETVQAKEITAGEDADEAIIELLEIEEENDAEISKEPSAKTIEVKVSKAASVEVAPKKMKISAKPSEAIATLMTGKPILLTAEDVTELKADADKFAAKVEGKLSDFDNAPKKVGEKLINTFKWLNGAVSLSRYTKDALALLTDKGEATTKMLETFYVDGHLGITTARSQTGQMKKLLPLLGIAKLVGDKLTLNEESTLVQHYKATLATATTK